MTKTTSYASTAVVTLLALGAAVALFATQAADLNALVGMTGRGAGDGGFGGLRNFLANVRDQLIPLALPLGGIGLTVGGALYMLGNPMAQRLVVGVIGGMAVVLLAPTIVQ